MGQTLARPAGRELGQLTGALQAQQLVAAAVAAAVVVAGRVVGCLAVFCS